MFRSPLDQIIDMEHPLVRLATKIDWGFLEAQFGAVYEDKPRAIIPLKQVTACGI